MNLELEIEFSKAPILQEVDSLKKQIDDMRPLPSDIEGRVMQKLRLEWNYNSNAIEGNKLSYGETTALLMHGITAKGKPLKDHLDIKGHNKAVEYLESIVKDDRDFTESDIRGLHVVILGESYESPAQTAEGLPTSKKIQIGKYKSMPNHVQTITGEIHYYATPEETPSKMAELMNWYDETKKAGIHPLIIGALFHHRFVAIHPFDDGNGRMARLLMNLILMRNGYPPVVVKKDDRQNYYSLLSQADSGEDLPFIEYISDRLKSSLELYVKATNGGDIDEDEDIDKEIALFKLQIKQETNLRNYRSEVTINTVLLLSIQPLIEKMINKGSQFAELFFDFSHEIRFITKAGDAFTFKSLDHYSNITSGTRKAQILDNLSSLVINFNFRRFKNDKNDFTIAIWNKIHFTEYNYSVLNFEDEILLTKQYDEVMSNAERSNAAKNFIINLQSLISRSISSKSPESN